MPRTIDEGFRDFLQRLTPSIGETLAAKRHRASIQQCIATNFGTTRFWRTGSFGNGTSISGYSDVDYMASISAARLHQRSSRSLATLSAALSTRFPNTGVRTSCPAVLVPFGTAAREATEITPAHYQRTTDGFCVYDIPDCSDGWIKASPDAHNAYVREADQRLAKKVKPLIRFIKAWKYLQGVPISSFYLELRIAKYTQNETCILYSIDVHRVFALLHKVSLASIQDPMGVSGYVSPCRSKSELTTTKSRLATALARAAKARDAERDGRNMDAFAWWDKLFAYKFPGYYK